MTEPSKRLEDFLEKATGHWNHHCTVCENKVMQRGATDHLQSQGHWKTLWSRLQTVGGVPSPNDALAWDKHWVQAFETPRGRYLFNHVTGAQQLLLGDPSAAYQALPPGLPELATQQPPLTSGSVNGYGGGGGAHSSSGPSGGPSLHHPGVSDPRDPRGCGTAQHHPGSAATLHRPGQGEAPLQQLHSEVSMHLQPAGPAGPAGQPGQGQPLQQSEPPFRNGIGYQEALNDKAAWKTYMDTPAKALENLVYTCNSGNGSCPVCETPLNGIYNHVLSVNHWKKLWLKLNQVPVPQVCVQWDKPWVEVFQTPRGEYLFNHVTGAQGFRAQLGAEGRGLAFGPAPLPASSDAVAPTSAPQHARLPPACQAPNTAMPAVGLLEAHPLDLWIWQRAITNPAQHLVGALAHSGLRSGPHLKCDVCVAPPTSLEGLGEHLVSEEHHRQLRAKLGQMVAQLNYASPGKEQLDNGPWVQRFQTPAGIVSFNHVTFLVSSSSSSNATPGHIEQEC